MTLFKIFTTLHYFVMVCLTINIVLAAPTDILRECMRQIRLAFNCENSSTDCFQYAVKHYIKGEDIPIPAKINRIFSQSQNIANPLKKVQNFEDLFSSRKTDEHQNDSNISTVTRTAEETNYANLYYLELVKMIQGTGVMKPSKFCQKNDNSLLDDYKACIESLQIFGNSPKMAVGVALTKLRLSDCIKNHFMYGYMKMIITSVRIVNIWEVYMKNYKECMLQIRYAFGSDESSTQCFKHAVKYYIKGEHIPIKGSKPRAPPIKVDRFEDLIFGNESAEHKNITNKRPYNSTVHNNVTNQNQNEAKFPVYVQNFDQLISSGPPVKRLIISNQNQNEASGSQQPLNYAMLYHKELEKMAKGRNILTPPHYCQQFHGEDYEKCKETLDMFGFGKTATSAVITAFEKYRLFECHDYFIYNYMDFIIRHIKIRTPSSRPSKFCHEMKYKNIYQEYQS